MSSWRRAFLLGFLLIGPTPWLLADPEAPRREGPAEPTAIIAGLRADNACLARRVASATGEGAISGPRPGPLPTVKVPARTADLIRQLARELGPVPAVVVLDGPYVEVATPRVTGEFLRALGRTARGCRAGFDLQVEQVGTGRLAAAAEAYRRRIEEAGGPVSRLTLQSRPFGVSRIRFTFAPHRRIRTVDGPPPGSDPPTPARPVLASAVPSTPAGSPTPPAPVVPAANPPTAADHLPAPELPEPEVIVIELPRDPARPPGGGASMVGVVSLQPGF